MLKLKLLKMLPIALLVVLMLVDVALAEYRYPFWFNAHGGGGFCGRGVCWT